MSVARTSISLPMKLLQFLNSLSKKEKISKSEKVAQLLRKEARREEMEKLQAQYNELARDPEYMKETEEWVAMANASYVKHVLEPDPYYDSH